MATEKFVNTATFKLPGLSESCSEDSDQSEAASMVVPQIVFSEDTKGGTEDDDEVNTTTSEMALEEVRRIFGALARATRRSGSTTPKSDGSNEFSFSRQSSLQPSHTPTRGTSPSTSRSLSLEEELQEQLYYTTSVAEDWKQRWCKEREEVVRVRDLWGTCERQCLDLVDSITVTFENANKELKGEIRSLLDHNDRLIKDNTQQQQELQEQIDRLEIHKHKLQNECIELNRQACLAENELRECSSENVYLRKKVTILESDKSVMCQRLNEMQLAMEDTAQEFQDTITILENQNSSLCEQLKQVRAAYGESKRETEAKVIELTNKVNRYEAQCDLTNNMIGHTRPRSGTWGSSSSKTLPFSEFAKDAQITNLDSKGSIAKSHENNKGSNGQNRRVFCVSEANHADKIFNISQPDKFRIDSGTELTNDLPQTSDGDWTSVDRVSTSSHKTESGEDINLESSIDSGCVTSLKNGCHLEGVESTDQVLNENNDLYAILLNAALSRLGIVENALTVKNKFTRRKRSSRTKGYTVNVDCDDPTSMRIEEVSSGVSQTAESPGSGDNDVFKPDEIVDVTIQPRLRSRTVSDTSAATTTPVSSPTGGLARSLPSGGIFLRRVGLLRQVDSSKQRSSTESNEERKSRLSDLGKHIPLSLISTSRQIRSLSIKSHTTGSPPSSPRSPDAFFQSSPTSDHSFNASITSLESQSSESAATSSTPRGRVLLVRSHTLDKQVIRPLTTLRKRSISEMDLETAVLMDSNPILRPIQHSRHLSDEVMTSSGEDVAGTRTSGFCALRARRNGIIDVLPDALPRNIRPAKKTIKAFDMFRKKSMDNIESKKERRKSKSLKKQSKENPYF